jgi:hypothetical protein
MTVTGRVREADATRRSGLRQRPRRGAPPLVVHQGRDIDKRLRRIDRQTTIALRLEIGDHHPHVSFEITHPETKSARRARACAVQSAQLIVDRRSKTSAHADLVSAVVALSPATRASEKFGVRFFDNSCTLCLTVSFSHP